MHRFLKYTGIILAVLTGLMIIAVVVVNVIPGEKYKSLIRSTVQSATGRDLVIEGDFSLKLLTKLVVKASGVKFANAAWGARPQMVSIDTIEGEVALFPLLKGILDASLVVGGPDLFLETDASGKGNWQFGEPDEEVVTTGEKKAAKEPTAEDNDGMGLRPLIRKLYLDDVRVTFHDGKSGEQIVIRGEKLHLESVDDKLVLDLRGRFNDIPLALSGGLDDAGVFVDNQPADIRLNGNFGDVTLAVTGRLGPLTPTFDLDLTTVVNAASMATFSPLAGRDLPAVGPLAVTARLDGKGGNYALGDLFLTLSDKALSAEARGSVADLKKMEDVNLEAKIATHRLTEVLKMAGIRLEYPVPDSLTAMVAVEGGRKEITVKQFRTEIEGRGVKVEGIAETKNIMTLKGLKADLSLTAESLDWIAQIIKTDLPPFGPLKASANIVSEDEDSGRLDINLDLKGEAIHADAVGTVGDPFNLKDIGADVRLNLDSLAWLGDYLKIDLPPLGALKATAGIVSKGDTFEITDFKGNLSGGKLDARITGAIGDLLALKGIRADVGLEIESLALFSDMAKTELPPLGPLSLSAGIVSKDETFALRDIKVELADKKIRGNLTASVEDLLKPAGVNAVVNFSVDSLASLDSIAKKKFPDTGPITLETKISSKGDLKSPIRIDTTMKSDGLIANLAGHIDDPLALKGLDLAFLVEAGSLQKLGKLIGSELQSEDSLKLEGQLTAGNNVYRLTRLNLKAGDLIVKGDALYRQPSDSSGRPKLEGKLVIGELDLRKFKKREGKGGPDSISEPEAKGPEKREGEDGVRDAKVFSAKPLPVDLLKQVDADLELSVERFNTLRLQLEDLAANLFLDQGLLRLKPLSARVGDGIFNGTGIVDVRNTPPTLDIDLEMKDGTFRDFGGKFDLHVDLKGKGDSIAAIMAGLNGQVAFHVREATLKRSFMTGFGAGLLDKLNPFDKEKKTTELICAIILFDIENGIAEANHKIAAQMPDVTWLGSGEINLKTEEIDFGMKPISRKALDIGMGELASLAHIGGTLAHPKIELDPKDVAVKYGKYTAAVATGGLTFAADLLWGKIKANTDVCAKILEGVVPPGE